MALFECKQFEDEHFHEYLTRFQKYADDLGAWGYHYTVGDVCNGIVKGMNLETRRMAYYMSNRRLFVMEPMECWDFLCFMSHQCLLVESSQSMPQPVETCDASLEDMMKDLAKRMDDMSTESTQHYERCYSLCHSTTSDKSIEINEPDASLPTRFEEIEEYITVKEEEFFSDSDMFFEDDMGDYVNTNEEDDIIEDCASPTKSPMPSVSKSTLLVVDDPGIPCSNLSLPIVLHPPKESSIGPNEESRNYFKFIHNESGNASKRFDNFCSYSKKPPLMLNWFEHMPFYEDWTHKFDKLKRFLNDMLFSFNLSLGYLCFFEMSSQEFDRLLRALTMSNLVKSYEASSHDDNQGAYREATRCS